MRLSSQADEGPARSIRTGRSKLSKGWEKQKPKKDDDFDIWAILMLMMDQRQQARFNFG